MKAVVQPEFLFSYYYRAAKNASDEVLKHKLPYSLYHALTSLVLWQCVMESYANFQIQTHGVSNYHLQRRNGERVKLDGASINKNGCTCLLPGASRPSRPTNAHLSASRVRVSNSHRRVHDCSRLAGADEGSW